MVLKLTAKNEHNNKYGTNKQTKQAQIIIIITEKEKKRTETVEKEKKYTNNFESVYVLLTASQSQATSG